MIVGAGFSGLLAAHIFQKMPIVEIGPMGRSHKALLRFRSDAVSKLTGIEFKRVKVRKGIFHEGQFHAPNISLANRYSNKCLGRTDGDRSIWSIETVDRFIAPLNFYEQLIESVGDRIQWSTKVDFLTRETKINTAPMPVVLKALGLDYKQEFNRSPITVANYKVPRCNAYQTVYFPTNLHGMYRASITGDVLIVEMVENNVKESWQDDVYRAMNIDVNQCELIGTVSQKYGKISEIDEDARKRIIYRLTSDFDIFSVGRFAIWKNILLDDVVSDLEQVKRFYQSSEYDKRKFLS